MSRIARESDADTLRNAARHLEGASHDYGALLHRIGDARFVLLGEASHGTHEFYRERAEITKRLITELGFTAIVVEADWPDAYRVNCFVRGAGTDATAEAALGDFSRFPRWLWRNTEVLEFVNWLRRHNDERGSSGSKVGFYGMDLYSLGASIEAVVDYLDTVDPEAARRARERYACFEHFGRDPQTYGYTTSVGTTEPCEDEVVAQLIELRQRATELAGLDGRVAEDEHFFAEQNARLAVNAEAYYREMFRGRASSWNLRDRHMADTLDALVAHLQRHGDPARVIVWAHNSHLGDARATEMHEGGELNVGQLVRERHGGEAVLVGFSTYIGTVTAASDWDAPAERKRIQPGLPGSYEALFHDVAIPRFLLLTDRDVADVLRQSRLQRAIGVIYRPESERWSHYVHARPADQFDALIHLDETAALTPLDMVSGWEYSDLPETFPTAV